MRAALISMVLAVGCATNTPVAPDPVPDWVTSLAQQLGAEPATNPPALIARYEYQGRLVYYVPSRCCDAWSDLYEANATLRCHPDGGLTGRGDGGCPDFLTQRKSELIIWRDSRGP
jgi:hypothetical protein